VRADTDEGVDMLEAAARRPVCGVSSPSDAHRRGAAASSFFATVPAKAELEIEPAAGTTFTVTIPDTADSVLTDCQDPLGRNIQFDADSYVRSDGVAVVRIPRFYPLNGTLPPNPTQAELDAFIAAFQAEVQLAFDAVKDAPQLIWDARSNFGGITLVGLAIAGGMPTSTAMDLSYCEARVPFSDPPALYQGTYAQYSVAPGGPFAYSGDVAVLIDDHDYSAADYFPLAVARATQSILVGTPTAGAYGGSGELRELGGTPEMFFTADPNRCSDADGEPLEGLSVEPDLYVEYAPEDLAAGVDTVMEAAAAALLAP
jgi:C-terminal processing protease CtpA/Prc